MNVERSKHSKICLFKQNDNEIKRVLKKIEEMSFRKLKNMFLTLAIITVSNNDNAAVIESYSIFIYWRRA
jgi:hypothetical protein